MTKLKDWNCEEHVQKLQIPREVGVWEQDNLVL